jgi:hypothetical protein
MQCYIITNIDFIEDEAVTATGLDNALLDRRSGTGGIEPEA